ncbi:dihydrolipoyllysine-residue acetyltransferase [Marinomonas sp. IMCC 4694]|uniref:dihydrolipoyllysine-residue acetyltransferase n=1 Tax=Marinomonas sp. IMCC 4694 TaxID=2605432 RepID=UPI0011E80852|nr:dihydrolipoyllysine-residue acetyltransferase [Marinomonas sp. IMCC 4694]TYL47910.1 dihydrolipoyllysine-residue acetyltransferase [Marinomonas sp. IMCC 4694]
MSTEIIRVPDIGGATDVEIIEISIKVGDVIEVDQSIIVLETDKASMDVPSSMAGTVKSISIKLGDKVSEGDEVLVIEVESAESPVADVTTETTAPADVTVAPSITAEPTENKVSVPDIGGATDVEVIEICVSEGDTVKEGDSIIVLETDKASMDIPSPFTGKVGKISIKIGDTVSEGADILVIVSESSAPVARVTDVPKQKETPAVVAAPIAGGVETVNVPDIGGAEGVEVIEVAVSVGDKVSEGDSIIVLETDKASMEIPAPKSGTVKSVSIKVGDKVSEGHAVLELEVEGQAALVVAPAVAEKSATPVSQAPKVEAAKTEAPADQSAVLSRPSTKVHAGPAVRMLARELGVALPLVRATGPRGRITKQDLHAYVKAAVQKAESAPVFSGISGTGLPTVPDQDFSKFGSIDIVKMSKIQRMTAQNMVRNALVVPQVTQFDKADITDLEDFRKGLKAEMEKQGVKLTPLPFLIKAVAQAMVANPSFNVSLMADGESYVQKGYVHIGVAVDSPVGLVVPVLRDADKKSIVQIAQEINVLIKKAMDKQLKPADMQGGCFTISSLGAIGGTGFTPIVNCPEVGILGVSKADVEPRWNGKEFEPRTMLPLCLSYDHRAVNGGDAGRFMTFLNSLLSDVRRLSL